MEGLGGGFKGSQGGKNTHFFQGLAIKLRFAVNWSNPLGLPQRAYVMAGKKRRDINKLTSGFGPASLSCVYIPAVWKSEKVTLVAGGRESF